MAASTINVYQGDTPTITVTLLKPDGTPYDLTGSTVYFTVKNEYNDAAFLIQKTQTVFAAPLTGVATFTLTAVDTAFACDQYLYDCEIQKSGVLTTAVVGVFKIFPQTTNAAAPISRSFMRLAEFKDLTGMKMDDVQVADALEAASEEMAKKIQIPQVYEATAMNTVHKLITTTGTYNPVPLTPIADHNRDGVVDALDINAYELDVNFNVTPRNADITTFNVRYGVVTFNTALPTSGKRLIIEFYTAIREHSEIDSMMKELNMLLAVNWLFQKVPFAKLQRGISSWTINGVNVTFDFNAMQSVMKANSEQIKHLYQNLTPIYSRVTRIRRPTYDLRMFARENSLR